jgi:hypothetical protein
MRREEETRDQRPQECAKPEVADYGSLLELTAGAWGGPRQDCLFPNRDGWLCGRRQFS